MTLLILLHKVTCSFYIILFLLVLTLIFIIFLGSASIVFGSKSPIRQQNAPPGSSTPVNGKSVIVNKVKPSPRQPPPLHRSPLAGQSVVKQPGPPIITSSILGIKPIDSSTIPVEDHIAENQKLKRQVSLLTIENLTMKKALLEFEAGARSMYNRFMDDCGVAQRLKIQKDSIEREYIFLTYRFIMYVY